MATSQLIFLLRNRDSNQAIWQHSQT